jgi:hypothetical protein
MLYENLPDVQTQENPLGLCEWLYDRKEGLLLHRLRLLRVSVPSEAESPKSAVASRPNPEVTAYAALSFPLFRNRDTASAMPCRSSETPSVDAYFPGERDHAAGHVFLFRNHPRLPRFA